MKAKDLVFGVLNRKIRNVAVYSTNRCNSRCKTCNIWDIQPKEDISLEIIDKILKDLDKKVYFNLSGGEFLMHPQYKEILKKFEGYNYVLFSNCVLKKRLIETVREFKIKNIAISCDGIDKTYEEIRGVNAFPHIKEVVEELKNETKITLNYTISPFNSKKDLTDVVKFCNHQKIKLIIGVYNHLDYFEVDSELKLAYDLKSISIKPTCLSHSYFLQNGFIHLYNKWQKGEYKIPCLNIRMQTVIYPNGDMSLCEGKQVILGNLAKSSFSEIWNSPETIKIQKEYRDCNDCFLICQRPLDVVLDYTKINRFIK
ncbi:MAG: radical SAM protein [archaeon]